MTDEFKHERLEEMEGIVFCTTCGEETERFFGISRGNTNVKEKPKSKLEKAMESYGNELEQAQREKNEARQSEIQTRIRLAKRPTLKYQPSKTFNELLASVMVALGIGTGFVASRFL